MINLSSSCKKVPSPQPTSNILSVSLIHIFLIISSRKASLIRNSFRMPCGLYAVSLLTFIIPDAGIMKRRALIFDYNIEEKFVK